MTVITFISLITFYIFRHAAIDAGFDEVVIIIRKEIEFKRRN